jgi:hypothetical protein
MPPRTTLRPLSPTCRKRYIEASPLPFDRNVRVSPYTGFLRRRATRDLTLRDVGRRPLVVGGAMSETRSSFREE